jgi:integrase
LVDREAAKGRGEPVGNRVGKVTFAEASTDIINDYTVNSRRTLGHLKRRLDKHLTPVFGNRRMVNITTSDIRAFTVERLEAKASKAEVNRELAILKRMFTLAIQAGKLLHRPHIPMLRENNVRTGFFERTEFEAVREQLPEYLRPLATFAYLTGWRVISEVLPLRIGQVDAQLGVVLLDAGTTKNDEARTFHYAAITELREILTQQLASAERLSREESRVVGHVFHDANGSSVNPRELRTVWNAACTAAGYPGKLLHDFRRSAVRNLVRAGIPERVAMMMTGHKTRSVFERYNIVAGSDLADAAQKLETFMTGKPADSKKAAQIRPFDRTRRRRKSA